MNPTARSNLEDVLDSCLFMALHGLSKKLPEKKHPRNRLDAYFSG
jgi:hypothetical protein